MANALTIEIRDRSKTAICRETLALCAKYDVTVEGMSGNGYIVLHDRYVMPNVWPYDPDGRWAVPEAKDAKWFGYAALVDGETEISSPLDLSMEKLVNKLSKHYKLNSIVPVEFSVYKTGEGLIGTGTMSILVTEPYVTTSQSFISFKGETGNAGTVSIGTTTTGNAGTSAQVVNSGTAKNAILDFTIPRGATGQAAGFGIPTATSYVTESNPEVSVTQSGPDTSKVFSFAFGIPRGPKGDTGPAGDGSYIKDSSDHLWHEVTVFKDPVTGERTMQVAEEGKSVRPSVQSPIANVVKTGNTATITLIDSAGTSSASISDGSKGDTPQITGSKSGKVTTLYSDGVSIATINDGIDGTGSVSSAVMNETYIQPDTNGVLQLGTVLTNATQFDEAGAASSAISTHLEDGSNLHVTTNDKTIWNGKYTKPTGGIPSSDLDSTVQAQLTDARTPTSHASTHATGGTDAISPSAIGAVAANGTITGGTNCKITFDGKGLVTSGANLSENDIPNLNASKITAGTFADARIASASNWNNHKNTSNIHVPIEVVSSEPTSPTSGTIYFITES